MTNAAGYYLRPVAPSTGNGAPLSVGKMSLHPKITIIVIVVFFYFNVSFPFFGPLKVVT